MTHIYDMIIVGGGPGGYTAALYGARAGFDTLVLEKLSAGGQIALTHQVDNYPGFDEGIDGFSLGMKMQSGAERFGAQTVLAEVNALHLDAPIKEIETSEGTFFARTVVIATGANPRTLGVAREAELVGRGIHYCAACDGMFYKGKTVIIVGGGNTAAADALLLSRVAKKVYIVHRRNTLKATKIYHEPLEKAENVELIWNSEIDSFVEDGRVVGAMVKNRITGEVTQIACDGIFVSVGRKPASELVQGILDLDASGYVIADESTRTNLPGVFVVGDVRTKVLRQVATAVADGAMAVHYAEEYLAGGSLSD